MFNLCIGNCVRDVYFSNMDTEKMGTVLHVPLVSGSTVFINRNNLSQAATFWPDLGRSLTPKTNNITSALVYMFFFFTFKTKYLLYQTKNLA